ncbi:MAG TPA: APC family permease [Cyclobacteriaceae bacterium]|nr:APC family permease [Cyclobacteriaceae bacterium]
MSKVSLPRHLSLLGLASTGICSMLGASIYVVPFMIQKNVPGIGPYVLPAFLFAAVPALMAAFSYSTLASAMPRAGGSYIYASRGLSPYLGFVASFSQWFGLSIAIGVISYVIIPFFRDIASQIGAVQVAEVLEMGFVRVSLALLLLWIFVYINLRGVTSYERTVIPLMILMFVLGAIVIVSGFMFTHDEFINLMSAEHGITISIEPAKFQWQVFFAAAALLFSSFIGFDSIAQAGGEAKNPTRNLPLAIMIAIFSVGCFYFLFTSSVYHAVPWQFVADQAVQQDITAAGILGYFLPSTLAIAIVVGAAIALLNDLPAMILSVSRLMFAWAEDGIFPKAIAKVDAKWQTPKNAIIASGLMASIGILGSHFAGDFFLGIDIMVTSMLVNFLLMCLTVITLPIRNQAIASSISVFKTRYVQLSFSVFGVMLLSVFLVVHIAKDIRSEVDAWYFHSTPVWLIVMSVASLIYFRERKKLSQTGVDVKSLFSSLPPE